VEHVRAPLDSPRHLRRVYRVFFFTDQVWVQGMSLKIYHFVTQYEMLEWGLSEEEIMQDIKAGLLPASYEHDTGLYRIAGHDAEKYLSNKNVKHSMKLWH
jgi:hypothetical protein